MVAVGHGTRSPAGRRSMGELRLAIGAARPSLEVAAAYVDVHKPALLDVVQRLREAGRPMVVLPLLLSTGFHVRVDIGAAVASAPGLAIAGRPLGPDPVLAQVLSDRLDEIGAGRGDAIVLAAAGSSDPAAAEQVEDMVKQLAVLRHAPVVPAYLTASQPAVPDAVRQLRTAGRVVSIATYLLAPGHFSAKLQSAGADRVAAPLGPHPAIAALALRRYDEALAAR
jgi:sirohydrochlorin ferrochelatase